MSSEVLTPVYAERDPGIDATDVEALPEFYGTLPSKATPEWCDLTPEVDITPDGNDGFATVRL